MSESADYDPSVDYADLSVFNRIREHSDPIQTHAPVRIRLCGVDDVSAAALAMGPAACHLDVENEIEPMAAGAVDIAWMAGVHCTSAHLGDALGAGADIFLDDEALIGLVDHLHPMLSSVEASRKATAHAAAMDTWSVRSLIAERARGGLGELQHAQITVRQDASDRTGPSAAACRVRAIGLLEAATGDCITAVQVVETNACVSITCRFAGGTVGAIIIRWAADLGEAYRLELSGTASTRVAVHVPETSLERIAEAQRSVVTAIEGVAARLMGTSEAMAGLDVRSAAAVSHAVDASLRGGHRMADTCFGGVIEVERAVARVGAWPSTIESKSAATGSATRIGRAAIAPSDEAAA
ncbi:MAG: hypothetical protein AB8G96_17485 [Phycisphaerales bacterium]